jgi:hypothetical protein
MTDGSAKRPSLREAARRGAAAKQPAQPAVAEVPKPAADPVEQVTARCGHPVPFILHQGGKDKFRDERRRHVAGRDCPACREKAHQERAAAESKAARERRRARAAEAMKDRLPHGSRFDVVWDAERGQWSGALTVPAEAQGEPSTFTASASGVFPLLRQLDRLYRSSLPAETAGADDDNRDVSGEG